MNLISVWYGFLMLMPVFSLGLFVIGELRFRKIITKVYGVFSRGMLQDKDYFEMLPSDKHQALRFWVFVRGLAVTIFIGSTIVDLFLVLGYMGGVEAFLEIWNLFYYQWSLYLVGAAVVGNFLSSWMMELSDDNWTDLFGAVISLCVLFLMYMGTMLFQALAFIPIG